jgi:short subunit fatty acids transporter
MAALQLLRSAPGRAPRKRVSSWALVTVLVLISAVMSWSFGLVAAADSLGMHHLISPRKRYQHA